MGGSEKANVLVPSMPGGSRGSQSSDDQDRVLGCPGYGIY